MKLNYVLETERLRLREFTSDDTAFIIELVNSPGWLQYIGDRNVKTAEQANAYLENGPMKSYQENGFGLWLVEIKVSHAPIGMCGILRRDYLDNPDIGFAFLPEYIGRGYGFEAATATLSFAYDQLKLYHILAITMPNNAASIKLLEKIGMKFLHPIKSPASQEELLLYSN